MKIHSILLGEFCSGRFLNFSVSIYLEMIPWNPQERGLREFEEMACENAKRNAFRMDLKTSYSLSINNFF